MPLTRFSTPFKPVTGTTAPSFNTGTVDSTSLSFALQSTALGRVWQGPSNRAVRLASIAAADYSVAFSSSSGIVASSSEGLTVLGGTVEVFAIPPDVEFLAIASSTDVAVNVTPGYGA